MEVEFVNFKTVRSQYLGSGGTWSPIGISVWVGGGHGEITEVIVGFRVGVGLILHSISPEQLFFLPSFV